VRKMFGYVKVGELAKVKEELAELRFNLEKKTETPTVDFTARLADVEIKLAKLWTVLVKIDARGTERPTNTARKMFGGQSRHYLDGDSPK